MYYSITFVPVRPGVEPSVHPPFNFSTARNTWEHWRLVPDERPAIAPPQPKTTFVDIPGTNGKLDLSRALTGYPTYNNRQGTINYVVMNDFRHWQTAYTDIMTCINGKRCYMVYEEDPEYYYVGLITCTGWQTGNYYSVISISYDLEPYKWRNYDSNDAWLWDPFNFSTGVITSRDEYGFNSSVEVDTEHYPISDDPGAAYKILLYTYDIRFLGDQTTTDLGSGYLDMLNNISEIIGNAPVVPLFTIQPREGKTDVRVRLTFSNPELPSYAQNRQIIVDHAITSEELTDIILTNYTGVNRIVLTVQGDGVVSWVYRPGRF